MVLWFIRLFIMITEATYLEREDVCVEEGELYKRLMHPCAVI